MRIRYKLLLIILSELYSLFRYLIGQLLDMKANVLSRNKITLCGRAEKLRVPVITINNKFFQSLLSGQDYQKLIELP